MPRRQVNQNVLNRGRFQAQGDGLEKSRPWAMQDIPTKYDGHNFLTELKGQLTPAEYTIRQKCFERAVRYVDKAPSGGYSVISPARRSLTDIPPIRDVRVDVELFSGASFKD